MRGMEKHSLTQMAEQFTQKHSYIQETKGSRLGSKLRLIPPLLYPLLSPQTVQHCHIRHCDPNLFEVWQEGTNIQIYEASLGSIVGL